MSEETWEPTTFIEGATWPWEPEFVATRGFRWIPESMILLMVEDNVTDEMCDAISGPADLALIAHGPLVGILARFGPDWDWAETLVWRRPEQGVPANLATAPKDTDHAVFYVVLVDTHTKKVRRMRAFTASPHFTKMLRREAHDRWADGTTREAALEATDDWERKYPTVRAALRGSLARCHGGD